ncbi:MAG: NAD-binding protein [Vicinamibacterales bacterium]
MVAPPGVIDAEEFADGAVQLLEYRLDPGSPLLDRPLADLAFLHGALIVAVRRGDGFFIPRGDTTLTVGDKVVIMGPRPEMGEVQRRVMPRAAGQRQQVTIIGGGDVGLRLAERLDPQTTIGLRIVERDRGRAEALAARLSRALVLHGDGTDLALLEAEDIGRSDVLVSVIDNDEKNLLASLLGRQLGAGRIITRVSKLDHLRLFERVGIDVALSVVAVRLAVVTHLVGRLVRLFGPMLIVPSLVAAYYREWTDAGAFLVAAFGTVVVGHLAGRLGGATAAAGATRLRRVEGMTVVAAAWLVMAHVAAVP